MFERLRSAVQQVRTILRAYLYTQQNSERIQEVHDTMESCGDCDLTANPPTVCDDHEDEFDEIKNGLLGTHE